MGRWAQCESTQIVQIIECSIVVCEFFPTSLWSRVLQGWCTPWSVGGSCPSRYILCTLCNNQQCKPSLLTCPKQHTSMLCSQAIPCISCSCNPQAVQKPLRKPPTLWNGGGGDSKARSAYDMNASLQVPAALALDDGTA